jgi:DNA-binding response OmpR family regulator
MKILVIDDDAAMTDLLKLLLEPTSSNVLTANDASERNWAGQGNITGYYYR